MLITKLLNNVFHVYVESNVELCNRFLRLSEYGESPKFKGCIFSLEQYKEWYIKEYGAWTYNEDWTGFNIPSKSFEPFFQGSFNDLTPEEESLVFAFSLIKEPFYVIATSSKSELDTIQHELLHALYNTNSEYEEKIDIALAESDTESLQLHLLKLGYDKSVLNDEIHAYLGASTKYLCENHVQFDRQLASHIETLSDRYLAGIQDKVNFIKSLTRPKE